MEVGGPVEEVVGFVHQAGFDFGVVAVGALVEPVGAGRGTDEFGFVFVFGVIGIDAVTLEPALFEGLEIVAGFVFENQGGEGAGAVFLGVLGGGGFAFR